MSNCLIMLTSSFPYEGEETFLENEIFFHENSFDKIIILALELSKGVPVTRAYPENADIYNTSTGSKKMLRLQDVFYGAVSVFNKNTVPEMDKAAVGKSLTRKVFSDYFEQRSIRQFNECKAILDRYDFKKYDDVLIYSYWFFSICRTGVYIKNYLKSQNISARLISRAHRYDIYSYINKLNFLPYRNTLASECEAVFACSENGRDDLKSTIPDYSGRFYCSYLGTSDYGTGSYNADDFHIVTCSRTTQIKRLDRLVSALANLLESDMKIRWTHIGDGPLQQDVVNSAKSRLTFMKTEFLGNVDNLDVINYYKQNPVSLFVNVSLNEGLPVSIMEAISFGIPVIATDVGGTGEIVKDGFNGFLLDKDFSDGEFVNLLNRIYTMSREEYESFRSNARTFWEKNFNAAYNYPAFISQIKKKEITV